jgi:hypothetical protein
MSHRAAYFVFSALPLVGVVNVWYFLHRVISLLGHVPVLDRDASPGDLTGAHYLLTFGLLALMYLGAGGWLLLTLLYPFVRKRPGWASLQPRDLLVCSLAVIGSFYGLLQLIVRYSSAFDWLLD